MGDHSIIHTCISKSNDKSRKKISFVDPLLSFPPEKYLMVKRLLGNHSSNLEYSQRDNLFHTRCNILDKTFL